MLCKLRIPQWYTLSQSEEAEQCQTNGGGEVSVFTNLVEKPEGSAVGTEFPTCTKKMSAHLPPQSGKLTLYPIMSCRVTPEGETLLNIQWIDS